MIDVEVHPYGGGEEGIVLISTVVPVVLKVLFYRKVDGC